MCSKNAFSLDIFLDFQNSFDFEVLGKLFASRKILYSVKIPQKNNNLIPQKKSENMASGLKLK
jgi:hypothetical protein